MAAHYGIFRHHLVMKFPAHGHALWESSLFCYLQKMNPTPTLVLQSITNRSHSASETTPTLASFVSKHEQNRGAVLNYCPEGKV